MLCTDVFFKLYSPGVTEAAAAACCGIKRRDHGAVSPEKGLKDQLGHALASSHNTADGRRIQEHDAYFTRVIGINKPHPLSDGNALACAETAAGIHEGRHARALWLNGYARRNKHPFTGGNEDVGLAAHAQINTCRAFRCRRKTARRLVDFTGGFRGVADIDGADYIFHAVFPV